MLGQPMSMRLPDAASGLAPLFDQMDKPQVERNTLSTKETQCYNAYRIKYPGTATRDPMLVPYPTK